MHLTSTGSIVFSEGKDIDFLFEILYNKSDGGKN